MWNGLRVFCSTWTLPDTKQGSGRHATEPSRSDTLSEAAHRPQMPETRNQPLRGPAWRQRRDGARVRVRPSRPGLRSQRPAGPGALGHSVPSRPAVVPPPVQVVMETVRLRAPAAGKTPEALGRQRGRGGSEHLRPRPGRPPLCQVHARHPRAHGGHADSYGRCCPQGLYRKINSSACVSYLRETETRNRPAGSRDSVVPDTVLWESEPPRVSSGLSWNSHEP